MYIHTESEYYTKLTVYVNMTCFAYHKFNIYNEITAAESCPSLWTGKNNRKNVAVYTDEDFLEVAC